MNIGIGHDREPNFDSEGAQRKAILRVAKLLAAQNHRPDIQRLQVLAVQNNRPTSTRSHPWNRSAGKPPRRHVMKDGGFRIRKALKPKRNRFMAAKKRILGS